MDTWWISAPVAFMVMIGLGSVLSAISSKLAIKPTSHAPGKLKAYACGEDVADHRLQPDYSLFFPFAFLFTIMHVVALLVATLPLGSVPAVLLGVLFLLAAFVGISILLRK
jgi:NADH:ubiquinone oxidoreductase subunit 3 (subunit A)